MTVREVITRCDALMPNTYTQAEKIAWLSQLDALVYETVLNNREGVPSVEFAGYDERTCPDTLLAAKAPFDAMYLYWLQTQIHYHNGELDRCNNAARLFKWAFETYVNHINRTEMAKRCSLRFF